MTFGIDALTNDSGELTFSADAFLFCYLGKATLSSVTHYTGDSTSSAAGYATYTFTSSGPIIPALGIGSSQGCIAGLSQSGSTWTITVIDYGSGTEGPSDATYGVPRSDSDVYVFGLPSVSALPTYGVALYNASGTLTADLLKIPLVAAARIVLPTSTSTLTGLPALVKPAITGFPSMYERDSTHSGSHYINTSYRGLWQWSESGGTGTLARGNVLQSYEIDDGPISAVTVLNATNAILIEANGLT